MLLVAHIFIALSSLFQAAYMLLKPQHKAFSTAFILIGLTLASGTALAIVSHAPLVQACLSGLIYLGTVMALLVSAHFRLARQHSRDIYSSPRCR